MSIPDLNLVFIFFFFFKDWNSQYITYFFFFVCFSEKPDMGHYMEWVLPLPILKKYGQVKEN